MDSLEVVQTTGFLLLLVGSSQAWLMAASVPLPWL